MRRDGGRWRLKTALLQLQWIREGRKGRRETSASYVAVGEINCSLSPSHTATKSFIASCFYFLFIVPCGAHCSLPTLGHYIGSFSDRKSVKSLPHKYNSAHCFSDVCSQTHAQSVSDSSIFRQMGGASERLLRASAIDDFTG